MDQIDKLANFIMAEVEGKPSQSEGAGDTAIRIILQLQDDKKKYLDCLKMILRRDCCSPLNSPDCDEDGLCDCVWERVCQTIDSKRWKELQDERALINQKTLVKDRAKNKCKTCDGKGQVPINCMLSLDNPSYIPHKPCPDCKSV